MAGSGTNILNLDYNNIVYNKPDLTIYAIKSDVDDSYSKTGNDPNYLKLSGGILTGNLTGTTISASNVSASTFAGSGENIFKLGLS